jgi:two-component system CheB/CheR fusion protein
MVCCRDVLIYLKPRAHKRLIPLFHYTLKKGGVLVLGSSETIGNHTVFFSVLDQKRKIFRKKEISAQVRGQLQFPTGLGRLDRQLTDAPDGSGDASGHESTAKLTQQLLLQEFTPTAVLVEPDGRIIHMQGKTGAYLEAVTGPPTSNIVDIARPGLRLELASALRAARTSEYPVVRREIPLRSRESSEKPTLVDIHLRPLSRPDALVGRILVVFQEREDQAVEGSGSSSEEHPGKGDRESRIAELERELQKTRENHQSTVEELESANEELMSTNEELQSANEELQSNNEKSESSKEELQALNEELQTANDQLEQKIAELRAVNDNVRNLLDSTEVASVFVDAQLKDRRFTPQASHIIHFIDSDVGRPLAHLATKLEYGGLLEDVKRASEALETQEKDVRTSEGTWYRMRVVPYRISDNRIDGAVLTFINIDEQKRAELRLSDARVRG